MRWAQRFASEGSAIGPTNVLPQVSKRSQPPAHEARDGVGGWFHLGCDFECPAVVREGRIELAEKLVLIAAVMVGDAEAWLEANGLGVICDRFFAGAELGVSEAAIEVEIGNSRRQRESSLEVLERGISCVNV
mgnify:CR=1 FL=1